jgi:hypothetical protein
MLASDIITRCERILLDNTNVRWPESELIDYINDAMRQIVLFRPDANSKNENVSLVTGTKQSIPATGIRLLRVVRNMGSSGTTPGKAIREISRLALDAEVDDWHSAANHSTSVSHYVFDDIDPRTFYVYPGLASGQTLNVEIIYSDNPTTVTTAGQTLDLKDHYINPVVDWVLYRAYSKDADFAGNMNRAQAHLQSFANELQITMRSEWMASSRTERAPTPPSARR